MSERIHNWADSHTFQAARIHRPTSVEEIQQIVAGSDRVKALGTKHSFNDIADTSGDLLSMEGLSQILEIDTDRQTVVVQAGVRYGELGRTLYERGLAVPNLASLPHISVAGACATATHGSGVKNGCLSTSVAAIELVVADGSVARLKRGDAEFNGAVVNLGALGIVTQLTLDVVPAFDVKQEVFEGLPVDVALENFEEVMSAAYSVSLFTDWKTDRINQVWTKSIGPESLGSELMGAKAATVNRHPILHIDPVNCTPQMGVLGPSHERLAHFRFEYTPSAGEELQSEYLVPWENATLAMQMVHEMRDIISPVLQISEIRAGAADDYWMSPFYKGAGVGVHFTWVKDWEAVRRVLPLIDSKLVPLGARPHWGKLFTMASAQVQASYPRLNDFLDLAQGYDPRGKFRNRFLTECLSAS